MTELEERLRRGMKKYSERIGSDVIRPLQEPSPTRRSGVMRWLAPAAAAIAVTGVVAGVSVASHQATTSRPSAALGMPRYYMTVSQTDPGRRKKISTDAVVHDSATGAALASVRIPTLMSAGGVAYDGISGAADDRTFLIYETLAPSTGPQAITWLFMLHVAANGRSIALQPLRITVPRGLAIGYLALSPDGGMLAMVEDGCPDSGGCEYTGIRVVNIATRSEQAWTTRKTGATFNVSWVGNSRVAFLWDGRWCAASTGKCGGLFGYRLLDVTGPGGNLLASTPIASPSLEPTDARRTALVAADGRTVFTSTVQHVLGRHGTETVVAKIIELNARTGRLLRVLHTVTYRVPPKSGLPPWLENCNVLSLGPSGVHLLVACFGFGRLDGSVFTPLPWFPTSSNDGDIPPATAAW
jgi:hypothetical protein